MPPDGAGQLAIERHGEEEIPGYAALGLTEKQGQFVRYFTLNGGNATEAARLAGYANPGPTGFALKNLPHVASAIARQIRREIETDGYRLAWGVIKQALERDDVRFETRAKAAFKVVDLVHARQDRQREEGDKRPEDMSADELRSVLESSQKALGAILDGAKPVGAGKGEPPVAGDGAPLSENGGPSRQANGRRSGGRAGDRIKRKVAELEAAEAKTDDADTDGAE